MEGKITTIGRVLIENNDILCDFCNTGIEFHVEEDFSMIIEVEMYSRLQIFKNDELVDELELYKIDKEDEEQQPHTFEFKKGEKIRIVKVSEAYFQIIRFKDILNKPIRKTETKERRKIEFIGDSLTSGYGNIGVYGMHESDSSKTWCVEIAKEFDCEYQTHSWSAMGLVRDSSFDREEQIMERRRRTLGNRKEPEWDFKQWKADYVIINIGTNDLGNSYNTNFINEFLSTFDSLIDELHENYGKEVKIILVTGPMMMSYSRKIIKNVVERNEKRNIKLGYAECDLDRYNDELFGYCCHPSVKGHQEMAKQIIPQIKHLF